MQQVRKLAVGLAVLAGTVGLGASLAVAQTDPTTPPTTEAPATPPTTEAPADAPRDRARNCPDKGEGEGGAPGESGANSRAKNTATRLRML